MSWTAGEYHVLAVIRLLFFPVAAIAVDLTRRDPSSLVVANSLLAVGVLYSAGVLVAVRLDRPSRLIAASSVIDLVLLAALCFVSGGPLSPLRFAFCTFPIGAALVAGPRTCALFAGASVCAYLAPSLTRDAAETHPALAQAGLLSWLSAASILFATVLDRRGKQLTAQLQRSRRLAAHALNSEMRERRRLADALHDGPVQYLLSARRELAAAQAGDPAGTPAAEEAINIGLEQLRHHIFDLYPHVVQVLGLRAAVEEIAAQHANTAQFQVHVDISDELSADDDQLLLGVVRELLANAAKHAKATCVTVTVQLRGDCVHVTVSDDGVGFRPQRLDEALAQHHFGLASMVERLEAFGGDVAIVSEAGGGTTVDARMPLDRERRASPRSSEQLAVETLPLLPAGA